MIGRSFAVHANMYAQTYITYRQVSSDIHYLETGTLKYTVHTDIYAQSYSTYRHIHYNII